MSADMLILSALRDRRRYALLADSVPTDMLGQDAQFLLNWYRLYWGAYPEHEHLDLDCLQALLKLRSGYDKEQLSIALHQTERLRAGISADAVAGIVQQLTELDLAGRAGKLLNDFNSGEEIDLAYELEYLSRETRRTLGQTSSHDWINEDIGAILADEDRDYGLKFPTRLLSEHISGVLGGTSIALAASPGQGKTSLLAFILTHWAGQTEKFFGPDRPILIVNNEGRGRRMIPRLYQAALGMTLPEIVELNNTGKLVEEYTEVVGRADRIRVKDMHGASLAQVEHVIEAMNPCVVVWDMLANVRLGGNYGNKAEAVEVLWQRVREMAVNHDFVSLATVQVSYEGSNMLYPPNSAMKDSKVGIQGATDIILTMGSLNDPAMAKLRGLATTKNKHQMPDKPGHVEGEVVFDAPRCQFRDGG